MDLVRRAGWGAAPPKNRTPLARPDGVAVHWNGLKVGSHRHAACPRLVLAIQRFHMAPKPQGRAWADIAYTVVVCEHGTVFEGRGLGHRTAANGTDDANDRFYAIMYLGGEGDPLTDEGMRGLRDARRWLVEHGGAGPLIRPHSSFRDGHTDCPGDTLRGCLADLGTPPAPPPFDPPPTLLEDSPMRVLTIDNGKLVVLLRPDGTITWVRTADDAADLKALGIPEQRLDRATYERAKGKLAFYLSAGKVS